MSKELEALYYFLGSYKEFLKGKDQHCQITLTREQATEFIKEVDEVKQALQRLESIDNTNPSDALECVNYIVLKLGSLRCECKRTNNHRCDDLFIQENTFNTIRQALLKAQEQEKMLEIIKEKEVNLGMLKTCKTVEQYNAGCRIFERNELTQEEFELVIKNIM